MPPPARDAGRKFGVLADVRGVG